MASLPWRKAKAKAISKFVLDRLQSSKHGGAGGSLVVETGFPTSLVHLFVKNRDRLKKPPSSSSSSIKKISKSSSKKPTIDLIPVLTSIPPPPPSSSASTSGGCGGGGGNPPPTPTPTPVLFSPGDSRTPANFLPPPTLEQQGDDVFCQGDCDSTMVFMAMLKMFLVVLLALATSKFVVGITLSAFLLLFMEYAGKHLCRLFFSSSSESSPPPPPPQWCMCMINKSLSSLSFYKSLQCFLGIKRMNLFSHQHTNGEEDEEDFKAPPPPPSQQQQDTTTTTPEYNNNNNNATGSHFHEIGISAPISTNLVPRHPRTRRIIPCVASESDLLNWANTQQQAEAEEEEDGRNDVVLDKEAAAYTSCDDFSESSSSDLKKRKSRRGKIKSKIKRLVSGNLKNKKRIKESSGGGNKAASLFSSSTSLDEDKLSTCTMSCSSSSSRRRMELVKFNQQFGNQGDDDLSMSSYNGICFSNELSRAGTENGTTTTTTTSSSVILLREEEEEEEEKMKPTASKTERRNSSSGYLIFFAMVLVGLVGGRALAIAFTLSWCLLLKSCGILMSSVAADDDDAAASSSTSS